MTNSKADWHTYACLVDDQPTTILLDLARGETAPDRKRPTLVRFSLSSHAKRKDGLPAPADLEALYAIEDQIIDLVNSRSSWAHVGAMTDSSGRSIFFYAPKELSLDESDFAFVPKDRRAEKFVMMVDDPEWSFYTDVMFPSPEEYQRMLDDHVLAALEKGGDNPEVPRRIDHWIYFEEAEPRDEFVAWAKENGFEVEGTTDPDKEQAFFGAQIHGESTTKPETIYSLTWSLVQAAAELGGQYDGWETMIVRPDDNAA